MAACGYTDDKRSKENLDFLCSPCAAKEKNVKAVKLCKTCNKYYCSTCLTCHDEIFTDHDQLGPEDFARRPILQLPTQRCGYHANELLQMFCGEHDVVICKTCVSIHHRLCSKVMNIPAEVQNLLGAIKEEALMTDLRKTLTTLKNDKQSLETSLKKLSDKRITILESVENHGQILKEKIDDLVKESRKEVDEAYDLIEEEFKTEVTKCLENQANIERGIAEVEKVKKAKNDPQLFVSLKNYQPKIKESMRHHANAMIWKETMKLGFQFHKNIINNLMSFKSIGSVITKHENPRAYTVARKKTIPVCQDGEKCCITGSCKLPNGLFLVVDSSHRKVIQLDSSCDEVTNHCLVSDIPYAICATAETEVAVSLEKSQTIQFVSVETDMALTKSLKFEHNTRGVAFSFGELFVSDNEDHVHVYDLDGNPLRTLGGKSFFCGTDHITVSPNGQSIYVSNRKLGLICIDRSGQHWFTFNDKQLKFPCGICTDEHGNVFVCGYHSNNIVQLSDKGTMLSVVLQSSNVEKFVSVCFDSRNNRLLVSTDYNCSISVYELNM